MPTSKTVNLKLWRQNFERVAAVQGEDKARVLSMVISEREGVPFDMSGYTAEIYMHEANGRDVTLPAEIDGNIVTAVIPLITAAGDAAIQVILTKSTGEILKVAGIVLDVQPSELENAVDGSDEFNLLVGVTKQAEKAAGDALEAADIALEAADSVKARADSGEFNGEKGDTGPDGPQGVSGVYVGSGDMPEGYTVQVDPTGDMLCYTAGESDSRYANVLTGTASGPVAALEDVSPTGALRRAAVLGATTETGEGDKGPDNPYTIAGVQPTKVTVCGRNMIGNWMQGMISTEDGNTITSNAYWVYAQDFIPISGNEIVSVDAVCKAIIYFYDSGKGYVWKTQPFVSANLSYGLANYADYGRAKYVRIAYNFNGAQETITPDEMGVKHVVQLEKGDTATPYEPYTGQTITLPALAPLHGDGTVCDEYDAATGVENRRWGRVELDGTEAWITRTSGTGVYGYALPDVFDAPAAAGVCTHFKFIKNGASGTQTAVCVASASTRKDLSVFTTIATLDDFKAWLAAQATAGTPMTVVYQLDAPVVTQHGPQRILPPAPVCRVFADAGNTAVGYNRDVNMAFEQQQAEYIAQIKALDARIAKLETGQPAEPMT